MLMKFFNNIRINKIVDRKLQSEVLGLVCITGISICLMWVLSFNYLTSTIFDALHTTSSLDEINLLIIKTLANFSIYFSVLTITCLLLSLLCAVFLSNRIAGPIFNITRVIDENLKNGSATPIKIRKDDFFQELVERINKLMAKKNS